MVAATAAIFLFQKMFREKLLQEKTTGGRRFLG
jgi:hypothetical protein